MDRELYERYKHIIDTIAPSRRDMMGRHRSILSADQILQLRARRQSLYWKEEIWRDFFHLDAINDPVGWKDLDSTLIMYEILFDSILHLFKRPDVIEFHLFSNGTRVYNIDTPTIEALRVVMDPFVEALWPHLLKWSRRVQKPSIFRAALCFNFKTHINTDEDLSRMGHINLIYMEMRKEGVTLASVDNLNSSWFRYENFHELMVRALKMSLEERAQSSTETESWFEEERLTVRLIWNGLGWIEKHFTCISLALRAALLLSFLETPETILRNKTLCDQDTKQDSEEHLTNIYMVCMFHLQRMRHWMLTNPKLASGEYLLVSNRKTLYEIKGSNNKLYVARGGRNQMDIGEPKAYVFQIDSEPPFVLE
jgi:hypothetical protein